MIQHFIARIDALGDEFHPIVVLMMRRQKLWQGFLPLTLIVHVILFLVLWCGERVVRDFGPTVTLFASSQLAFTLLFPFILSFGGAVNGYYMVQKSDPLLMLTSLSDRSIWLGFYLTGLLNGLGAWCLSVLTLSYCYALHWVSLEWVWLYPLLSLFAGYFCAAIAVSMNVAAKTVIHRCFLFPIWFLPLWCAMMVLMQPRSGRTMVLAAFFRVVPASLFEPVCWVPVLVVAVPVYLLTAWKLFHFNLVRRRSFFVKYSVSLLVYLTLTALLVALWFALRFCLVGI